ncbi:hypothetical protein OAM64_01075 [Candidatus Thioglobus sp.]|nr:hypothetical protein [Candidatus Thioglobus sp.]
MSVSTNAALADATERTASSALTTCSTSCQQELKNTAMEAIRVSLIIFIIIVGLLFES